MCINWFRCYGAATQKTVYNELERKYMLEALKCVHRVFMGPDTGLLDFALLSDAIKPDIFFVNQDGNSEQKRRLIELRGITYLVSSHRPHEGLPVHSTTAVCQILQK